MSVERLTYSHKNSNNQIMENKTLQEIISDDELTKAWGYANFGSTPKREVIYDTLKKVAQAWGTGRTAMCIVKELGLTESRNNQIGLSDKGLKYLLAASSPQPSDIREQALVEDAVEEKKVTDFAEWAAKENLVYHVQRVSWYNPKLLHPTWYSSKQLYSLFKQSK